MPEGMNLKSMDISERMEQDSVKKRSRTSVDVEAAVTCALASRPLVDTNDPSVKNIGVRCGVNGECLISEAVTHVIGVCPTCAASVLLYHDAPCLTNTKKNRTSCVFTSYHPQLTECEGRLGDENVVHLNNLGFLKADRNLHRMHASGSTLRQHREHLPHGVWLECAQVFLRFIDQLAGRDPEDTAFSPCGGDEGADSSEGLQVRPYCVKILCCPACSRGIREYRGASWQRVIRIAGGVKQSREILLDFSSRSAAQNLHCT